jgi:hypothetical protein
MITKKSAALRREFIRFILEKVDNRPRELTKIIGRINGLKGQVSGKPISDDDKKRIIWVLRDARLKEILNTEDDIIDKTGQGIEHVLELALHVLGNKKIVCPTCKGTGRQ